MSDPQLTVTAPGSRVLVKIAEHGTGYPGIIQVVRIVGGASGFAVDYQVAYASPDISFEWFNGSCLEVATPSAPMAIGFRPGDRVS